MISPFLTQMASIKDKGLKSLEIDAGAAWSKELGKAKSQDVGLKEIFVDISYVCWMISIST